MRLADFIADNIDSIVLEWEAYARSVWPEKPEVGPEELRDHAVAILRAVANDMKSLQSAEEQSEKSKGKQTMSVNRPITTASALHGVGRAHSGLALLTVISEYRALRASVIRLWRESIPKPHHTDLNDLTRFNESMDQSLTESVRSYTGEIDRSRELFLAILGHDLRNPLNAVTMSAKLLARDPRLAAELSDKVSQISRSSAVMSRMISDLADFTAGRVGKAMQLSPVAADLENFSREVFNEVQSSHPMRTLRYESRGDLTGEWDADRLRQVVSNLLGNAVQHGTGLIDLSLFGQGQEVRLSVRNEGAPIPKDLLPLIFDPLISGLREREQPRRPGSLGLGLYIAREIVTAHGGTIDVESSVEAGTIFTVRLPRHPPR